MAGQGEDGTGARRRRANGEQSRRKILDAAVEVAGERGYDGTSIALVSAKCGLPASSIYWHFKDKDDLIAAVIERSFAAWLAVVSPPGQESVSFVGDGPVSLPGEEAGTPRQRAVAMALQVAKALLEAPDFLRLGLMLALEHRPEEPRARAMFLRVREVARVRVAATFRALVPAADEASIQLLTTYAVAAADGLFIAKEIGGDSVDLLALFELHAGLVFDAAAAVGRGGDA